MDAAWINEILGWVHAHPLLAMATLAAAVAVEGLFLIGMVIPGSLLMFGAGAVVAAGHLPLAPMLISAALGATLGDLASYALGRRYRRQLFALSARFRMPRIMDRGERFFAKHGGKSIILGRFIGPLRPLVPAVAGAADMRLASFIAIDIIAAVLWAPAYALPGLIIGATITVAAEVASRLALIIALMVGGTWLLWWLVRTLVWLFQDKAERWIARTMDWSHRHRRLGHLGPALADPEQPETPILAACTLALLVVGWLLGVFLWGFGDAAATPVVDEFVYDWMAGLQTPGVLALASSFSALASSQACLALTFSVLIALVALRHHRAAAHWAAAALTGVILGFALPGSGSLLAPGARVTGAASSLLLMVLLFCLAGLLATRHHSALRVALYSGAGLVAGLVILAKLILGGASASQLGLALVLALTWTSLLLLGFRRHLRGSRPLPVLLSLSIACAALSLATLWTWDDQQAAQPPSQQAPLTIIDRPSWRRLRASPQPERINLLWLGTEPEMRTELQRMGWTAVPALSRETALNWFKSRSEQLTWLPPLPQALSGRLPTLEFERQIGTRRVLIRLWPSQLQLGGQGLVWRGTVGELREREWLGLLTIPVARADPRTLAELRSELSRAWRLPRASSSRLLIIEPG